MTDNVAALRQLLLSAPHDALPMTYQQVASALALTPPRTIAQVTQALEQLMREDAAQQKPLLRHLSSAAEAMVCPRLAFLNWRSP
ncbi:hypothetical protein HORIV_48280 [Vreelandella olivaria]|uniref:Uncharacterized protein n=1 Tax=Vreelandella olivaria TaxID=390919 RepID=A0ABM7GKR2_9GAMM|nr:hypothetical protein HORIV_48280 [Halomonas olivaria]